MLYMTRYIQDAEPVASIEANGKVYEDENVLKVVEKVYKDHPEYKNIPIVVTDRAKDQGYLIGSMWGNNHEGYDVIVVEQRKDRYGKLYWQVDVELDDIPENIDQETYLELLENRITNTSAKTFEEAVAYGKSKSKRDNVLFLKI